MSRLDRAARLGANRLPPAVVIVVVMAVLAVLGGIGHAVSDPTGAVISPSVLVPVASTELVCPAPIAQKRVIASTMSAVQAPLPGLPPDPMPERPDAAQLALQTKGIRTPVARLDTPGATAFITASASTLPPVLVTGTGSLAPGLAADQLTHGRSGQTRGLATLPCAAPVTDSWFVGGGSGIGRTTTILFTNIDAQAAQVDVVLFGTAGPIDAPTGRGILVPGRGRTSIKVVDLAPGQPVVAIHIIGRVGRIALAVLDQLVAGLVPRGLEYLPATSLSRLTVIPGLGAGTLARTLSLISPLGDATVGVRLLTDNGAITPVGLESIDLPAGKVVSIALDKALAGAVGGLALTSDLPIAADVHQANQGQLRDVTEVAGTPTLDGPAVIAGLSSSRTTYLQVAAAGDQARFRVTVYAVGVSSAPTTFVVTVPARSAISQKIPVVATAPWSWVLLEPLLADPAGQDGSPQPHSAAGGLVHVARLTVEAGARGTLVAMSPVWPLRATTSVATAEAAVGLPLVP